MAAVLCAGAATTASAATRPPAADCTRVQHVDYDPGQPYTTDAASIPLEFDRLWVVPPAGSCATVVAASGGELTRIAYADGRTWAEWRYAPLDQGVTFFTARGRVGVVANQVPAAASLVAKGRRTAIAEVSTPPANPGSCTRELPRIRGTRSFAIVVSVIPEKVEVSDSQNGVIATRLRRGVAMKVTARTANRSRRITIAVTRGDNTVRYAVCFIRNSRG